MNSITRVGIGASKDRLDVVIDRPADRRKTYRNDKDGVAVLQAELDGEKYLVAIEASGRYEALARHELTATGHTVRLQNPRQVRRLAEGMGTQAKTDLIDAQILAKTAELCGRNEPRSEERRNSGTSPERFGSDQLRLAGAMGTGHQRAGSCFPICLKPTPTTTIRGSLPITFHPGPEMLPDDQVNNALSALKLNGVVGSLGRGFAERENQSKSGPRQRYPDPASREGFGQPASL